MNAGQFQDEVFRASRENDTINESTRAIWRRSRNSREMEQAIYNAIGLRPVACVPPSGCTALVDFGGYRIAHNGYVYWNG